jgi:hypothetical protein
LRIVVAAKEGESPTAIRELLERAGYAVAIHNMAIKESEAESLQQIAYDAVVEDQS